MTGFSASGITSGLSAAGSVVGSGMVAGIGVLATPPVILGIGDYVIAAKVKGERLRQEKERLYIEALASARQLSRHCRQKA